MAKKFAAQAAKAAPAQEAETEEVEVEEAPTRKGSNAPRKRKWNYGITPASVIRRVKDATCPKGVADQWDHATTGTTVEKFLEAGGDRHGLRVMMRGKAITLTTSGQSYPVPYDHEAAAAAKAEKEAAKAARAAAKAEEAEEAEEEEEEEAPAPAPKKPAGKKK